MPPDHLTGDLEYYDNLADDLAEWLAQRTNTPCETVHRGPGETVLCLAIRHPDQPVLPVSIQLNIVR